MDGTRPTLPEILIVEDDDALRRVLARNLRVRGFDVGEASTVAGAIKEARRRGPRLLLLDIELPDGTGWDLLRALRERDIHPAVVVISAAQARPERVAEFAPVAVLRKPFPLDSLLRLAAEWARAPVGEAADA